MKGRLTRAARGAALIALAAIAACAPPAGAPRGPQVYGAYPLNDLQRRHPQTRAERSGFTATSTYADVMAFIDSLKTSSKDIYVTTMGRSTQGKDIPLVVLARPLVRSAAEAKRSNRPVVYIQGNIHGGEVEGKEALLSLVRDLARDPYQNVVDSLVIVAAPIYNIDGNEAIGPQETNRSEQNGPALVGQRANGQGLDLNRDYIKAEAPETRASLELFRTWEPDVFVDLHTTDGSYHGYALTWAPPLNPAARFTGPFTRDTLLLLLRNTLLVRHRIETFPYGNFVSEDSVERGWFTYDHRPRFGTNYFGLRGRIAVLSEAYSHDPFRTRIASTYAFVMGLLSILAANREDILEAGREADRRTTSFASSPPPNGSPPIALRSRITRTPHVENLLVEETIKTGDSVRYEAGLPPGLRRGRSRSLKIPVYDRFDPILEQALPYAWVIPQAQASLLERLRLHGIFIEQVDQPTVVRAERFQIDTLLQSPRPFQGHREIRLNGHWVTSDSLAVDPGTYIVRAAQPLGILALYLLEPQSDDGFVTWNVLDEWLPTGRYPVARVVSRIMVPLHAAREN